MKEEVKGFSSVLKGDKGVWFAFFVLMVMSLFMVYSASVALFKVGGTGMYYDAGLRHAFFLVGAFMLAFIIQKVNYRYFALIALGVYGLMLLLLILMTVFNIGEKVNGAVRSFYGFQPLEFMKCALIVLTAFILGKFQEKKWANERATWVLIVVVALGGGMIMPENFSTAALIFVTIYSMMFIGRVRWTFMVGMLGCVIVLVGGLYFGSKAYAPLREWKRVATLVNRIDRFVGSSDEEKTYSVEGADSQVYYSKSAIARGQGHGTFFGNSDLRNVLPQAYSDYIYSIIFEETGYFGALAVMLMYLVLLYRAGVIARKCARLFPAYLVMGCALMMVYQAVFNMCVAVDLLPVTGQPLPLVSRGGTSILMSGVLIGIMLSVSVHGSKEGEAKTPDDVKALEE